MAEKQVSPETSLENLEKEWVQLDEEFAKLENDTHKHYQAALGELNKWKSSCAKEIHHQRYRATQILKQLGSASKKLSDQKDKERIRSLKSSIDSRKDQVNEIADTLPKQNGLYLRIILGGVNVSLTDQNERYAYKAQYESFKLAINIIIFLVAIINLAFHYRIIGAVLHFLLVWYHCTLTIRESILKVNGSRIKGWWRAQQFITTIQAGVMVVWPDGRMYDKFAFHFLCYICYISVLQYMQYFYQRGQLYRLRALGERHDMDITLEGFHSWMWRGLTFLLPFLCGGYFFQAYNAYFLWQLSQKAECLEWQVPVTAFIFALLFLGNVTTTVLVIQQKLRHNIYRLVKTRYGRCKESPINKEAGKSD